MISCCPDLIEDILYPLWPWYVFAPQFQLERVADYRVSLLGPVTQAA